MKNSLQLTQTITQYFFLKNDFTTKWNPGKFTFNLNISNKEKEKGWEREDLPTWRIKASHLSLALRMEGEGKKGREDGRWRGKERGQRTWRNWGEDKDMKDREEKKRTCCFCKIKDFELLLMRFFYQ